MSDWQPIETAPKDGTRILLGGCKLMSSVQIGWWGAGRYINRSVGYERDWTTGSTYGFNPTHWMQLPQPPEQQP